MDLTTIETDLTIIETEQHTVDRFIIQWWNSSFSMVSTTLWLEDVVKSCHLLHVGKSKMVRHSINVWLATWTHCYSRRFLHTLFEKHIAMKAGSNIRAFDSVPHSMFTEQDILLATGLHPILVWWIGAYLKSRSQWTAGGGSAVPVR